MFTLEPKIIVGLETTAGGHALRHRAPRQTRVLVIRSLPTGNELDDKHLEERLISDFQVMIRREDGSIETRLAVSSLEFGLLPVNGHPWCEIDTSVDLERARTMFGPATANGTGS